MGYNSVADSTGLSSFFIRLALIASETREMSRYRDEKCLPRTTIQLAERSGLCTSRYQEATLSIQAATHALNIQQVGYGVRRRVNNGYDWTDIFELTLRWRWTASITAMSCCLSRCFQQSSVSQNVVYSQNNMLLAAKFVIFCVLWFPKVR